EARTTRFHGHDGHHRATPVSVDPRAHLLRALADRAQTCPSDPITARFARFVASDPHALSRTNRHAHVTASAVVVEPRLDQPGKVFFGAVVEVEDEDGQRHRYQIVGESLILARIGQENPEFAFGDRGAVHNPIPQTSVDQGPRRGGQCQCGLTINTLAPRTPP
ncbi:MAG: hypothetical protein HC826_01445, partial [Rhodospirillales bacterium]|nr:hypothetical protein [Rhodospirillales bacterium]